MGVLGEGRRRGQASPRDDELAQIGNDAVGGPPSASGAAPIRGNHRHRAAAAGPSDPIKLIR
jgi:hypothetical protein